MPECTNCNEFVTEAYVRVFGAGGAVGACRACSTISERASGEAASRPNGENGPGARWCA